MLGCLTIILLAGASPGEDVALPSGLDLLYSDRVILDAGGEPLVPIGIMTHQQEVELRAPTDLTVDYYELQQHKRTQVNAGSTVKLTVRRSQAAKALYYAVVEGVPRDQPQRLRQREQLWRKRGYKPVEILDEGTLLGIGGRILDNRLYQIAVRAPTLRKAQKIASSIYSTWGVRAHTNRRLQERPWGEILLEVDGVPVGLATTYIRFVPDGDGAVSVASVEFGKGYSWHGREARDYRGQIYVAIDSEGKLGVVNVVGLETVLEGVVPSELFAVAHPQALRAQAIAARNQVLVKLSRRHYGEPFHLCSDQHCQVYTGRKRLDQRTSAAVRATAGQVLLHDGRLVDTVYSSTCGGHTEDNDAVWGNTPDPALRGRPDFDLDDPKLKAFAVGINERNIEAWVDMRPQTYCQRATHVRPKKFRWETTFNRDQLNAILSRRYPSLGRLRDVRILERGVGGKVMGLELIGALERTKIHHELPIRRLFQNLNSGTFALFFDRDDAGFVSALSFRGGGWGHGAGMCQLGAIGRAEAGHSYRQILGHYYNGAKVVQLYRTTLASRH